MFAIFLILGEFVTIRFTSSQYNIGHSL